MDIMVSIVSKHLHSKWYPTDLLFIWILISMQTKSTPEFSFTPMCLYTSINLTLLIYCMATTQQNLHIWHLLQLSTRNALHRLSVRLIKTLNALFSACFFIACLFLSFSLFVLMFCFLFVKYWFMVVLLFVLCVYVVLVFKSFLVSWLKCSVLSFFISLVADPLLFPL